MPDTAEQARLQRLRAGDEQAFIELVRELDGLLRRLARGVLRSDAQPACAPASRPRADPRRGRRCPEPRQEPPMMTCREMAALANDHVDGRTAGRQRLAVRFHLMMCKHCRRAMRQLQATLALIRAAGTAPAPSPPSPADEGALAALFRKHRGGDDEPPR
jgi:hypothetical protein